MLPGIYFQLPQRGARLDVLQLFKAECRFTGSRHAQIAVEQC